ncbi:MAG: ribosome-associated translation inhibitor RaiA [Bacteroidetes bacterium]|nr:MAG: ribosome-associated translation inhibitor RaiA [Bacteroidota bacterium]
MKVQTESVKFKADQKLITHIEKKLSKLDQFFDRIIGAEVKLRLENSGQVRDKIVEIRLSVPGTALFAKETSKSFEAATDLVLDNLKRQIAKYKAKLRLRGAR